MARTPAGVTAAQTSRLKRNPLRPEPTQAEVQFIAESIQACGQIIQPIEVRIISGGYEIQDGEKRWLAAQSLGMDIVPIAIVEGVGNNEASAIALMNSMQREVISPSEIIGSLEALVEEFDIAAEEIVTERVVELKTSDVKLTDEQVERVNKLLTKLDVSFRI